MLHLKMEEEGEERAEHDDDGQYGQLLKIPHGYGFQNLRRHLEFQAQRQSVGQLEFDVVGILFDQSVQIVQEGGEGGHGHHKNTDQFTNGNQDFQNNRNNMFEHSVIPRNS